MIRMSNPSSERPDYQIALHNALDNDPKRVAWRGFSTLDTAVSTIATGPDRWETVVGRMILRGSLQALTTISRTLTYRSATAARAGHDGIVRQLETGVPVDQLRDMSERIQDLADARAFLDWLEQHPEVPMPYKIGGQISSNTKPEERTEASERSWHASVCAAAGTGEVREYLTGDGNTAVAAERRFGRHYLTVYACWPTPAPEDVDAGRCPTCGEWLDQIAAGTLGHVPGAPCAEPESEHADRGDQLPDGVTLTVNTDGTIGTASTVDIDSRRPDDPETVAAHDAPLSETQMDVLAGRTDLRGEAERTQIVEDVAAEAASIDAELQAEAEADADAQRESWPVVKETDLLCADSCGLGSKPHCGPCGAYVGNRHNSPNCYGIRPASPVDVAPVPMTPAQAAQTKVGRFLQQAADAKRAADEAEQEASER